MKDFTSIFLQLLPFFSFILSYFHSLNHMLSLFNVRHTHNMHTFIWGDQRKHPFFENHSFVCTQIYYFLIITVICYTTLLIWSTFLIFLSMYNFRKNKEIKLISSNFHKQFSPNFRGKISQFTNLRLFILLSDSHVFY